MQIEENKQNRQIRFECFKGIHVMSLSPLSPHCHSPATASAPASAPATATTTATATATSAGSAPDPELCICSTIQHHDDFPARAAKRAADQHQSAAEQHTRHCRGHFHTGPTDSVSRQPKVILGELLLLKPSCLRRFE